MTREAALLGVPTLTLFAGRQPEVDRWLERRGLMRPLESADQLVEVRPRSDGLVPLDRLRARGAKVQEIFVEAVVDLARVRRSGGRS